MGYLYPFLLVNVKFLVLTSANRPHCIVQNDAPRDADADTDAVQLAPQNVHINLRPSNNVT